MKLYLSSYRIGDHPEKLTALLGANRRAAIIANAKDEVSAEVRQEKLQKDFADLGALGIKYEEVDLREFFSQPEKLAERLTPFGLVWVRGGNAFLLRRAMADSGFDQWLKTKVSDPDFVYGGYSAGVCVLAPTLRGIDLVDHPELVQQVYGKEPIWEGLGLLEYSVAPHYRSNHPESELIEQTVTYFQKNNLPYKTLRDGEVIVAEI